MKMHKTVLRLEPIKRALESIFKNFQLKSVNSGCRGGRNSILAMAGSMFSYSPQGAVLSVQKAYTEATK